MAEAAASFKRSKARMIFQAESSECGLACIAMVCSSWRLPSDLTALRQCVGPTPQGTTLRGLLEAARKAGLAGRSVRVGLRKLDEISLPAVLHWNFDHFVVLTAVRRDGLEIADPAAGRRRVAFEDASRCFTGIAIEFSPAGAPPAGPLDLKRQSARLWAFDAQSRRAALAALALTLLFQAAALSLPFLYRKAIDSSSSGLDGLYRDIAIGIVMIATVQSLALYLRGRLVASIGARFLYAMASAIVGKMFSLPVAFFRSRKLGSLVSRVHAIDHLRRFVADQALPLAVDLLIVVTALVALLFFSPLMAGILIACLGADIAIRLSVRHRERACADSMLEAQAAETSALLEGLRNIQAVKVAAREGAQVQEWQSRLVESVRASHRLDVLKAGIASASLAITSIEWILLILASSFGRPGSALSMGTLFGVLAFRALIRDRSTAIMAAIGSFQLVASSLARVDDVMRTPSEREGGVELAGAGNLVLDEVGYVHPGADAPQLQRVSISIPQGAYVAITGASGAGKSTLAKLILGLEFPTRGDIAIDGVSVRDASLRSWRRHFGAVTQEDTLAAGTIAENICFFDPQPDPERIAECARLAAVDAEVERLPMRYNTYVGDGGGVLSGGQRQRILIARALYHRPKILLLDEGTANIDSRSEQLIGQALAALDITRIVVAHRSSLIDSADKVYVVQAGALTEVPRAQPQFRPAANDA